MRLVIQRVSQASVSIDGREVSRIAQGLMVLVGISHQDTLEDVMWLAPKLVNMRIFSDSEDKMNLSVSEIGGEILLVSQFTLHASTKKGNRPSFIAAARPEQAIPLYEAFIREINVLLGKPPATGVFGAMMQVTLVNDGPVTILIDSHDRE